MKRKLFGMTGAAALLATLMVLAGCPTDGDNGGGGDTNKVATPTANPVAGEVSSGTEITLATTTEGAAIYYTTDGNAPTKSSTKYSDTNKPKITAAATLKVIAYKDDMTNSDVLTAAYTVTAPPPAKWVIGGDGATILSSADGVTWTTLPVDKDINPFYFQTGTNYGNPVYSATNVGYVAYGGGIWVAVGGTYSELGFTRGCSNKIATSTDGNTWTAVTQNVFINDAINAVAYGNGIWLAMGEKGKIAKSTDGTTWEAVTGASFVTNELNLSYIVYGNNRWFVKTSYGYHTSIDGINWTYDNDSSYSEFSRLTYNGNIWFGIIAAASYYLKSYTSSNGIDWTMTGNNSTVSFSNFPPPFLVFGSNTWVFVYNRNKIAKSTDNGANWSLVADSSFGTGSFINDVAFGDGKWVAVGRGVYPEGGKIATSTDGTTWVQETMSSDITYLNTVAYKGN
jgi:hypothetical protein